jgi:hypothetical protein
VQKGHRLHLMDPTATPENKTKNRNPAIWLLHVDQTVQFNLGSISETPFQAATFLHVPNKQTGTLVIILVLVGMLREPTIVELSTINSVLFGLRREVWSHSLCHKPLNHGMTTTNLYFMTQTNRQEPFPSSLVLVGVVREPIESLTHLCLPAANKSSSHLNLCAPNLLFMSQWQLTFASCPTPTS